MKICVAVDEQGGFAKDNAIPWNIKEDFLHFMETTRHSWCITGKNSYLEMVEMKKSKMGDSYDPLAPVLKDRETYVVSSTLNPDDYKDCIIIHPDQIFNTITRLELAEESKPIFILGGQQLFEQLLPQVDEVIMTTIPANFNCDRFFPVDELDQFVVANRSILQTKQYGDAVSIFTYNRNVC